MDLKSPRWKGRGFADTALANPMSAIVDKLQNSLIQSKAHAMLAGCDTLLEASPELGDLLNKACFGRTINTSDKDRQIFQLGPEEAFYLCHTLKCLIISVEKSIPVTESELWMHFKSNLKLFPELYKAYAHLRSMNWVVRSGTQYGVDFVAYRHHPALVHSEYAVLVLPGGGGGSSDNFRLRVWSDLQCSLRVCGSVAKTLLILHVDRGGSDATSPLCLEEYIVGEQTITRWVPEQCREDNGLTVDGGIESPFMEVNNPGFNNI